MYNIFLLYVNRIEKTKLKEKRAGMAHFKQHLFTFCHLYCKDKNKGKEGGNDPLKMF